jgi:hypothetical protein
VSEVGDRQARSPVEIRLTFEWRQRGRDARVRSSLPDVRKPRARRKIVERAPLISHRAQHEQQAQVERAEIHAHDQPRLLRDEPDDERDRVAQQPRNPDVRAERPDGCPTAGD